MKSFLIASVLLFSSFISAQDDAKRLELNVGFETPQIEVKRGSNEKLLALKILYDGEAFTKNNLDGFRFEVKVNQEETDIADKYYKLYLNSSGLSQLAEQEKVLLEIKKDILPDRARKLVLDIYLLGDDNTLELINKAKYQKLEIIINPYQEVDKASTPTDGPNQFYIDFVGTANLQANLSEASDEVQGAAGLGVIFERYFLNKNEEQEKLFEINKENLFKLKEEQRLGRNLKTLDRKISNKKEKISSLEDRIEKSNNPTDLKKDLEKLKNEKGELESAYTEKEGRKTELAKETKYIKIDRKFKRFFESLDMEAYINVASSVDSLEAETEQVIKGMDTINNVINKRLFGNYVLNPVSSRQSVFINSDVYFNPELLWVRGGWITKWISGANFRINASNVLWSFVDGEMDKSRFAGALNIRFGLFHEFLPNDKIRDNNNRRKYSVRLGLNYTFRELTGDISSPSNSNILNDFLGTMDTSFSGIEPSFGFRLNNIIAEFSMPMIGGEGREDIQGLTDTQFLFSIRFVGGFSIKVDDKK